jgi:hypothetical protein
MDKVITAYKAARLLGCRYSLLSRMAEEGVLRKVPIEEYKKLFPNSRAKYVFHAEDIERLKEEREKQKYRRGGALVDDVSLLKTKIDRLEDELRNVSIIVGMVPYEIPTERGAVLELVDRARTDVDKIPLDTAEVVRWCRVFMNIDQDFLKRAEPLSNGRPWAELMHLSRYLQAHLPAHQLYLRPLIIRARTALKSTVLIYEQGDDEPGPPDTDLDSRIMSTMLLLNPGLLSHHSPHRTSGVPSLRQKLLF